VDTHILHNTLLTIFHSDYIEEKMDSRYFNNNFMSSDVSPWNPSTPQASCYVRTTPILSPYPMRQPYQFPFQVPGYLMRSWANKNGIGVMSQYVPFNRTFKPQHLPAHPMMYHGRGGDQAMVKNSRSPHANPQQCLMDRNIMYSFN
jgi:hypothetical protein